MNKILVFLILGMGLTGSVLIFSVSLLFNPPIENVVKIVIAGSATAFVILAVSALVIRRRLNEIRE